MHLQALSSFFSNFHQKSTRFQGIIRDLQIGLRVRDWVRVQLFNSSFPASHYHNTNPFHPMSYSLYLKPTWRTGALKTPLVWNIENRTRTQSRTRSPIWRSLFFSRKQLESESLAKVQFVIDSCRLVSQSNHLNNSNKECDWLISACFISEQYTADATFAPLVNKVWFENSANAWKNY